MYCRANQHDDVMLYAEFLFPLIKSPRREAYPSQLHDYTFWSIYLRSEAFCSSSIYSKNNIEIYCNFKYK